MRGGAGKESPVASSVQPPREGQSRLSCFGEVLRKLLHPYLPDLLWRRRLCTASAPRTSLNHVVPGVRGSWLSLVCFLPSLGLSTLPIQSSVTPDRPARLLLRFATAEELRRCSAALAEVFPEDADSLQKAASPGRYIRLQGRADAADLSQSSFFGFYSREADTLLPMHVRDQRPLSDMVERMRQEKNGLGRGGGGGGIAEGKEKGAEGMRPPRTNVEEKELARDQTVLAVRDRLRVRRNSLTICQETSRLPDRDRDACRLLGGCEARA